MNDLLDNIVWHALSGPQARFACGTANAERHAHGFSPIVGFIDPKAPDFASLASHVEAAEPLHCDGWRGAAPQGWQIEAESTMFKMVWDATLPLQDDELKARPLGLGDAAAALELVTLTKPGPFGPRTIELGDYFGVFEGERLMAMAGERMQAGTLREASRWCAWCRRRRNSRVQCPPAV